MKKLINIFLLCLLRYFSGPKSAMPKNRKSLVFFVLLYLLDARYPCFV